MASLQSNSNLTSAVQGAVEDMVANVENGDVDNAREIAQQMVEELMKNAVNRINNNTNVEKSTLSRGRQLSQQSLKEFNEKLRKYALSTNIINLKRKKSKKKTSVIDADQQRELTSQAIQRMYGDDAPHPNVTVRRRQPKGLQLQPQDDNIRRMIAANKKAKLQKLADLFRAKRNITLAEKDNVKKIHLPW